MAPLTSERPKAEYNCTQQELYQICFLTWDSYLENVADFTNENTTYTLLFGQNQRAAVKAAKKMPDFQQRDEASETFGILLKEAAEKGIIKWQSLEGYIKKSFPEKLWKTKLEGAGSSHYEKAADFNWEEVSALMESGETFITDNNATLTTGGMPGGFAVAATAKPSSGVILNPDDVVENSFGSSVKFENKDAVTAAECTVRVSS